MTKKETTILTIAISLLVVILLSYYFITCIPKILETTFNVLISLLTGTIASIIILYVSRLDKAESIDKKFKHIEGTYRRKYIVQYDTEDNRMGHLRDQNNGLKIILTHEGENIFSFEAQYWKDEGHIKIGIITFNEFSEYIGNGAYKYKTKKDDDIGTYKIERFIDNPNRMYVYYENTIPKNGARGFEIWEK